MPMRAALYERVSTDQQAERYGIASQDWGLKKRAQERGYSLVLDGEKDAFVDDGYSGSDLGRPALTSLRQAIHEGRVDVMLCYDPDRLSRSLSDLLLLTDEFEQAKTRLEFITQELDASPEGKMFFAIRGAVAEYERAKIRERTIRGRLQKARQGKVISKAAAPFGYRYDPTTSTLVINEEEAKVIRFAFYIYTNERLSLVQLADRLNRMGMARPHDGQRWRSSYLGRMLRNETYAGTLWQNRWRTEKIASNTGHGPHVKMSERPQEDQIPVAVPAIVTQELFSATQKRLKENLRLARRNSKREYLLSGLLRHACGSCMGGRTHGAYNYYFCYKTQKFKAPINDKGEPQTCPSKWVNGKDLEVAVWERVPDLLRQPALLQRELENLTRPDSATREALQNELAQVERRLEELPKEEQRLVEGYRKGFYADFMMREEMERVCGEQTKLQDRYRELELKIAQLDSVISYKGQIQKLAERLSQGLDSMDFEQRRELLRLLVDEVLYDDGHVTIKTVIPLVERRLHPISGGIKGVEY
jgi:site-specific DNA recombinase